MTLRLRLLSLPLALATGSLSFTANAAVINGTSGSNTDSTGYSTTGNLDLSLGFVAEYLIGGGGGGGGTILPAVAEAVDSLRAT